VRFSSKHRSPTVCDDDDAANDGNVHVQSARYLVFRYAGCGQRLETAPSKSIKEYKEL